MNSKQTELLKELWYSRNPVHESNTNTGEDMFWGTVLCVIDDYNTASLPSKPVGDVEEMLNKTMFMAGGNTDEQKDYYSLGFKSGYAAAPQKGMRWVRASERLPEKAGVENAVIIRGHTFVTYGFKNHDKENPQFYYTDGSQSYLTLDVEWLDESPSHSEAGDGWVSVEQYLPGREDYYEVKFEDGTIDEKPFRIRYSKNILGFMTESKVAHWRPFLPRQNKKQ